MFKKNQLLQDGKRQKAPLHVCMAPGSSDWQAAGVASDVISASRSLLIVRQDRNNIILSYFGWQVSSVWTSCANLLKFVLITFGLSMLYLSAVSISLCSVALLWGACKNKRKWLIFRETLTFSELVRCMENRLHPLIGDFSLDVALFWFVSSECSEHAGSVFTLIEDGNRPP